MLNPTLGRNLGRWAQAYFTNPPEKREQAVLELLRELEAEGGPHGTDPQAMTASNGGVSETHAVPESVVCAECGHQNGKPQRFCGMCGSSLEFEERRLVDRVSADNALETAPPNVEREPSAPRESVFPTLSLFAQLDSEPAPQLSSSNGVSEIQWLRDRNSDTENSSSSPLKYVLAGVVILVAGAFFYNQSWTQGKRGRDQQGVSGVWTGAGSPTLSNQPPSSSPLPSSPRDDSNRVVSGPVEPTALDSGSSKRPTPAEQNIQRTADKQASIPAFVATPKNGLAQSPTAPNEPASLNAANGSFELATAEEFLRGKKGPRDSTMAAKFLWMAVSKENTTAILLLSDLYLAGDGVPKSCDQARLLLYAAARKNVPEAGQKLRNLQVGCP